MWELETKLSQFARRGGTGEFFLVQQDGQTFGKRLDLAVKAEFADFSRLRTHFSSMLDGETERNTTMLLQALGPIFSPPLHETDLLNMASARSEALAEWDRRFEIIWEEWETHQERIRSARQSMERRLLHSFSGLINELRQRALGIELYIWRSRDDDKVRSAHAENDDRVFRWDSAPGNEHPGQAYNCRCFAEPFIAGISEMPGAGVPDSVFSLDEYLLQFGSSISAGQGVRPRENLFGYIFSLPESAVTVNGVMLTVQTQGDLAVAFYNLDDATRSNPQAVLDLMAKHGENFETLAQAFGRLYPDAFAAAAILSLAGAPQALVDQALTQTRHPIDRLVGGYAVSLADIASGIAAIPDIRWSDIKLIAQQIYEDPSSLPEAMVQPFRDRIAVGDYAGALGYGLPEVLGGIVGLGRLRDRAANLPEPLQITHQMLDRDGKIYGVHNAGLHTPRFDRWIDDGGLVHMTPDGHFQLSLELDLLGERRIVQVVYKDGFPDFSDFTTHSSGIRSVEIEMIGDWDRDFRAANMAAGHPEWGNKPPRGWTWHHHEDMKTMMLIPSNINGMFDHQGGASLVRRATQ